MKFLWNLTSFFTSALRETLLGRRSLHPNYESRTKSAANYKNWIWVIVSWKTEFQNDFYEKLFLGTSFMKNRFWERIYEKLNLKMRFREKLKNYNFLRKYVKKQIFRKIEIWIRKKLKTPFLENFSSNILKFLILRKNENKKNCYKSIKLWSP